MNVEKILDRLEGVRRNARGWSAKCPAHPDRSPSLSIREGDTGILLKCWAGCEFSSIVAAIGLQQSDLFFALLLGREEGPRQSRAVRDSLHDLEPRLRKCEKREHVVIVRSDEENLDAAIVRALVLTVEEEIVQIVLVDEKGEDVHGVKCWPDRKLQ